MFELIYPIGPAPLFPGIKADGGDVTCGEYLPVVEESGVVIGRACRDYCHSGTELLHPVVH